ncbi:MAG: GNAT family N-acetyltransferase [Ideonella sp.]|nr:GNAT family N-acetyltransferase [Ideonella sp.]
MTTPSRPAVFEAGPWRACALSPTDAVWLQAFFDANPLYFITINGQAAGPHAAQLELEERPPAEMPYREVLWLGFVDPAGALQGMANVVADLLAPGVWHTGLFIVATALHGTGAGRTLYQGMEDWMRRGGARWLRLGVVLGNAPAEAFWQRMGYTEVRRRFNVDTGGRLNTVRVMVKPLTADAHFEGYLAMVARDHPDAALP